MILTDDHDSYMSWVCLGVYVTFIDNLQGVDTLCHTVECYEPPIVPIVNPRDSKKLWMSIKNLNRN